MRNTIVILSILSFSVACKVRNFNTESSTEAWDTSSEIQKMLAQERPVDGVKNITYTIVSTKDGKPVVMHVAIEMISTAGSLTPDRSYPPTSAYQQESNAFGLATLTTDRTRTDKSVLADFPDSKGHVRAYKHSNGRLLYELNFEKNTIQMTENNDRKTFALNVMFPGSLDNHGNDATVPENYREKTGKLLLGPTSLAAKYIYADELLKKVEQSNNGGSGDRYEVFEVSNASKMKIKPSELKNKTMRDLALIGIAENEALREGLGVTSLNTEHDRYMNDVHSSIYMTALEKIRNNKPVNIEKIRENVVNSREKYLRETDRRK